MRVLIFIILLSIISACSKDFETKLANLEGYMERNQLGSGEDYWLVKQSFAGSQKVALVFGFLSDLEFCFEVAELYMQKYPSDTYTCEYAN